MKNKEYPWTDKAAGKIAGVLIRLQTKFANSMYTLVADWPDKRKKIAVILFGILAGGWSIFFFADAVFHGDQQPAHTIDKINTPKHFDKTGEEIITPFVNEDLYREIQIFKKSVHYDSTIRSRPGLVDSIVWLEEMYESQRIK